MKVLVVEADETTRKVTGVMLNRLGYMVALTSDCDEAFRTPIATRDLSMWF